MSQIVLSLLYVYVPLNFRCGCKLFVYSVPLIARGLLWISSALDKTITTVFTLTGRVVFVSYGTPILKKSFTHIKKISWKKWFLQHFFPKGRVNRLVRGHCACSEVPGCATIGSSSSHGRLDFSRQRALPVAASTSEEDFGSGARVTSLFYSHIILISS